MNDGRYAKIHEFQERALPDARDGLKPVQSDHLYAMNELNLTRIKPYKNQQELLEAIGNTTLMVILLLWTQW
nr:hypothetical protein [Entomoplasma sp. MP1]